MEHGNLKSSSWLDIFIHRPVVAIVLCILICLAGVWGYSNIPVQQFPKIESSSLQIQTTYTGASADVVKGFISEPVERVASTIPGVDYVESKSTAGNSTVTVWLKLDVDSNRALTELSARLSQVSSELPAAAEDPVISVTRADRPFAIFYLNVHSEGMTQTALTDYIERQVNPVINSLDGVLKAETYGGRKPSMRIWLDSDRLALFNLSAREVFSALETNNSIATLGYAENSRQRIDFVTNSLLSTPADFKQLVIKQNGNNIIYLQDVANVELASEEATSTARLDQQETVYIAVWSQPGTNEIEIGNRLYTLLDKINPTLPHGMKIGIPYDATTYMRNALKEIGTTLLETVVLVGIVVLAMMGSFRTALVPLVTIPVSILGAIAAMQLFGFTLNLLTVLAIVLSVGLVVDDAIVVVENVSRLMREGMSRTRAALLSSRQLLVPIIAMTLTLAAVYAPIGFLSGLTGVLFKEFAFTLAIAVIFSGIVAITLSPIMSAQVSPEGGREGWLTRQVNRGFARIQQGYKNLLVRAFNWRGQVVATALLLSCTVVPFYLDSPKELAPMEDESMIMLILQVPPDASLKYNTENIKPVVDNLLAIEKTELMWQTIQPSGGFAGLGFVSPDQRDFTSRDKIPEVYQRVSGISGLDILPITLPPLPTAGQFDVEMVIRSSDSFETMKNYADLMIWKAYESGRFLYADTDLKIDLPRAALQLDRDRIADLGMTVADVSDQLSVYLSTNFVNRFDDRGKAYKVIPLVSQTYRADPEKLLELHLKTPTGEYVPVSTVATLNWETGPRSLASFGQQNAFRIYGGLAEGVTKEQALEALEAAAAEVLPPSYSLDYAGESRELRRGGNTLLTVLGVSLLIVYLVLAVQFNSFRDPLTVLLGCVPLALAGALMLSYLGLTTINIYSQIGLITLVGLIAKNGILIVEFANHMQEQGMNRMQAVIEAASTRLRPVLMTTAATVLGHFPLVLVTGAGAEARNSIGIILVAGMMIGTLFTLFVLPMFYTLLATDHSVTRTENGDLPHESATA
ncbi:efflux RND transporter permease subunit [Endozoicomonadaceae bacterium StTr2]